MTNSEERIIIYSAACASQAYAHMDGVPMQVEVTKKTIVPRPMTSIELKKATEDISKTIDAVKALNNITKAFADALEDDKNKKLLKEICGKIAGVAEIIKGILQFFPGTKNPMVEAMQKLIDTVENLKNGISDGFKELKALITEVSFFVRILSPVTVMSKYMGDCMRLPGPDSKENFKRAYSKHTPVELIYTMISCFESDSTNPMKLAVEAGKKEAKIIFDTWKDMVCRIMGHLLMLESFANGLFGAKNDKNIDLLIDRSIEVMKTMHRWNEEYKKAENWYWDELQKYMAREVVPHTEWSSEYKINLVQKKCEELLANTLIFRNDAFVIGFFESTIVRDNEVAFHCQQSWNMISFWNRGLLNAFVYCSVTAQYKTEDDYLNLQKTMESIQKSGLVHYGSLNDMMNQQIISKGLHGNHGFLLVIRTDKDLKTRYVSRTKYEPARRMSLVIPKYKQDKYLGENNYEMLIAHL